MADAMEAGALAAAREMEMPLHFHKVRAADATADDVLQADGYLFCCPENLASTSGEMLEFFHRTYYTAFTTSASGDESSVLTGRPYGLAIAAGNDGSAAARQVERICTGWRLRKVCESFVHRNGLIQTKEHICASKVCSAVASERCQETGGLVAATVLL